MEKGLCFSYPPEREGRGSATVFQAAPVLGIVTESAVLDFLDSTGTDIAWLYLKEAQAR